MKKEEKTKQKPGRSRVEDTIQMSVGSVNKI